MLYVDPLGVVQESDVKFETMDPSLLNDHERFWVLIGNPVSGSVAPSRRAVMIPSPFLSNRNWDPNAWQMDNLGHGYRHQGVQDPVWSQSRMVQLQREFHALHFPEHLQPYRAPIMFMK